MKTLILHSIISSNTVYKLNSYIEKNKKELGQTFVIFCGKTEKNRRWVLNEKINFNYEILPNYSIRLGSKDLFTYFVTPTILKKLNEINPQNIIISGWDQFAYQLGYFWALLRKRKITIWSGSTSFEKSWRRTMSLPLVRFFVKISDNYIAYGKFAKDYLVKLGADPNKIKIFINDVNKKYFENEAKKYKFIRKDIKQDLKINKTYNFIFVGQLIARKGLDNLIDSFIQFSRANSKWGLIIVGYGKKEKYINKYINKNKVDNIFFNGATEQYDLPIYYSISDCLILPSYEEVWGLVVNEALYSRLKVIVSNRCGCWKDLINSRVKGLVFDIEKKGDLLNKMKDMSKQIEKEYE